jgi:hypothetical protein
MLVAAAENLAALAQYYLDAEEHEEDRAGDAWERDTKL